VLLGGATYALWAASAAYDAGEITSGDLRLQVGTPTWEQVTPGVTAGASGVFDGTPPADFFTMPGDVIEIAQPVTTTLDGDNLAGAFRVAFADGAGIEEDVAEGRIAVTYTVRDASGATVAPDGEQAELGQPVVVPGLVPTEDGSPQDWTVAIRVDVLGEYVWTDGHPVDAAGLWSAGGLVVSLEQVREGDGFRGGDAA
jgi:alternate signal-mediated exported protein